MIPKRLMAFSVPTLTVLFALLLVSVRPAQTQTETVLHSFGHRQGRGTFPYAGLVLDKKGNLYGTTYYGGDLECTAPIGCGTLFELTAAGKEMVLHRFGRKPGDGTNPHAGLIFDKAGNLYGTTYFGGNLECNAPIGCGTVFELTAAGKEKVLYSFDGPEGDGAYPTAGLTFDKMGNLYGTTTFGGDALCNPPHGCGTVFELTASGTYEVLYSFGSQGGDGWEPFAGLTFDKMGNLYGTTTDGGSGGTVFELTAAGTEMVLHRFSNQAGDGVAPFGGVTFDKKGNLYGTTEQGGVYGYGTVFELTAAGTEKVLYSFGSQPGDGYYPNTGLTLDKKGNLYGTTSSGGNLACNLGYGCGTVFALTKKGTERVLYTFASQPGSGEYPDGGLTFDKKGNLYGATLSGGAYGYGTVFKLTPIATLLDK